MLLFIELCVFQPVPMKKTVSFLKSSFLGLFIPSAHPENMNRWIINLRADSSLIRPRSLWWATIFSSRLLKDVY